MKKLTILLIALLAVGGFLWKQRQAASQAHDHLTLPGNVEIRKVDLGFQVGGKIAEMPIEEGERVKAGQLIARLEDTPYQEELALAIAQQEQAAALLAKLTAGSRPQEIVQAEALVREREATVANLELEYKRLQTLLTSQAIARRDFDNTSAALNEAKARLTTAREALTLVREGPRQEDIDGARATLRAADARIAIARTQLEHTKSLAPDSGVVLTRVAEPGAIIGAGQTVLTLSLDSPVWVRAYIEEPSLGLVHPGMAARINTDSRPKQPYEGHVGFISPEAEFTPKTVQTEELRTRLVYQVRIVADNPDQGLRQGMPVTVTLLPAEEHPPVSRHE